MFTTYKLIEHNRHMLFDNGDGLVVVDTGSPYSFHKTGILRIGEVEHKVPSSLMEVDAEFLSVNIGVEISGLVGMDIIGENPVTFNVGRFGEVIMFESDHGGDSIDSFSVMGYPGVVIIIGGREMRVLVDSGAPISYISTSHMVNGVPVGVFKDFSILSHERHYEVDVFEVKGYLGHQRHGMFNVRYAAPPADVGRILSLCGIDGIIGYDFFSQFRLTLSNGVFYLPPQGI